MGSGWMCESGCGGLIFLWCTQRLRHPHSLRASSQHLICITGQSQIVGLFDHIWSNVCCTRDFLGILFKLQSCVEDAQAALFKLMSGFLGCRGFWARRQTVDLGALTWINQLLDHFNQICSQKGTKRYTQQQWNTLVFNKMSFCKSTVTIYMSIWEVWSSHLQCALPERCFK